MSFLQWLRLAVTVNTLLLLGSLAVFFLVFPFVEGTYWSNVLFHVLLTMIYVTGLFANRNMKQMFWVGVLIVIAGILLLWVNLFVDSFAVLVVGYFVGFIYLGFLAFLILLAVLKQHGGTHQAVLGAIAVYLLLGLAWAVLYRDLEILDPDAFHIPHRRLVEGPIPGRQITSFSQLTYFSFVTMSTLGYGDITPRSPAAETATWMQSVLGQFFLAAVVARFVNAIPAARTGESRGEAESNSLLF